MKKERLESFQNFEVDPSPGLWKKIEADLPAKKRRRWFLFWILSGIIISAAGIKFLMDDSAAPIISHAENKKQNVPHIEMRSETVQVANNFIGRNDIKDVSTTEAKVTKQIPISNIKQQSPFSKTDLGTSFLTKNDNNPNNIKSNYLNINSNTSSEIINKDAYAMNNTYLESLIKIDASKYTFAEEQPSGDIISREIKPVSKKKLTRWMIYAGAAYTKSSFKPYVDTTNEFTQTITGLNDYTFSGGVRYDVSSRIRISIGLTSITRGQERSGQSNIVLQGQPLDPNNTYTINTGIGDITGLGTNFDQTFFNTSDSILFPLTAHVFVTEETVKTREFTLKEEFKYLELPITISIRANERRITPNAGIIFSTGYLYKHSIELNDKKLEYDYQEKLSKYIFSAGVTAGFDINLSRSFAFFVNGFYEKNLNSVITGDSKWKPYVYGAGAGFNYRITRNGY